MSDKEKVTMLSVRDVAEMLNVSTRTVHRLIDAKEFPAYRVGNVLRIYPQDVQQYLERQKKY
jgi:excisionase family DNA binding protein